LLQTVFGILDYLSWWLQEKNSLIVQYAGRNARSLPQGYDQVAQALQTSRVEQILQSISPEKLARRAAECGSYARSVLHLEEHMRRLRRGNRSLQYQYQQLQQSYEQINEPDAIQGIAAQLHGLDLTQQILDHRQSGRFNAALGWYELQVQESPKDTHLQSELLSCLRSAGRYGKLLNGHGMRTDSIDSIISTTKSLAVTNPEFPNVALPYATEAAWFTGRWDNLKEFINTAEARRSQDFNVGLAKVVVAIEDGDDVILQSSLKGLRKSVCQGLTSSSTSSLSAVRPHLLKLHILYEMEVLGGLRNGESTEDALMPLHGRLEILGSFTEDKQFVLGLRRAAMSLSK
jgi:serine/threonine-protein kinase ATR